MGFTPTFATKPTPHIIRIIGPEEYKHTHLLLHVLERVLAGEPLPLKTSPAYGDT